MAKLQLSTKSSPASEPAATPPTVSAPPPPLPGAAPGPEAAEPVQAVPPPPPPPAAKPPPLPSAAPAAPSGGTGSLLGGFLARMIVKVIAFLVVTAISLTWYFMTNDDASLFGFLYGGDEEYYDEYADGEYVDDAAPEEGGFTYDQRDDWPAVELSGMVAATRDEQASAILNGSLVVLNQRIEGARLIEIRSDGVVLEYKGDRKFILVGEGTL